MLSRHFGLDDEDAGYCLRSILSVGKQRKAQITTYFPPDIGEQFDKDDFTDVLIFQSVQPHARAAPGGHAHAARFAPRSPTT